MGMVGDGWGIVGGDRRRMVEKDVRESWGKWKVVGSGSVKIGHERMGQIEGRREGPK